MALRLTAGRVLAAASLAAAGCGGTHDLRVPSEPAGGAAFMARYVAIGNSITAGYQSGGINDTTQRRAYPALVARAAGVPFAVPSIAGTQCGPVANAVNAFRSAAGDNSFRPPGGTCLRVAAGVTDRLNNVAVPGARSADPAGLAGGGPNPLTTLILGGRTQVQRALELDPTFVSVWIGSNDVLDAAIAGDVAAATPLAAFRANYDAMMTALTAGAPERRGILVGVVSVTGVGVLFPAAVLVNDVGGYRAQVEQALLGGRRLQFVNCPANTASLVSLGLLLQLAALPASTNPIPFACSPTTLPNGQTIGAAGILDAGEQATLAQRVADYNAHIQARAAAAGWAYWDPNPLLASYRASQAITPVPVLGSAAAPFGTALSYDGIHPSSSAHVDAANQIIQRINAFYGSSIPPATAAAAALAGVE